MANLYPGPFFGGWVILLIVILALLCIPIMIFSLKSMSVIFSVLVFPPALAILWFIFWRQDKDKATYSGIAKFYFFGLISTIPVAVVEYIGILPWVLTNTIQLQLQPGIDNNIGITIAFYFYMSFIVAAFTEENAKFIHYFCLKKHEPTITHPYSVVILLASFTLGFASFESFWYVISSAITGDVLVIILTLISRSLLSMPLHTITGILIGCHMSKHYFKDELNCKIYWQALWKPFLIHGAFDVFAFAGSRGEYYQLLYIVNLLIVIGGSWLCFRNIKEVKSMIVDHQQDNALI